MCLLPRACGLSFVLSWHLANNLWGPCQPQNKSIHIPGLDLAFSLTALPLGTNIGERLPLSHRDANPRGSQGYRTPFLSAFQFPNFLILQLQGFPSQDNLQFTQGKHIILQQISGQRQTIPFGILPPTEPFYNECLPKIVLTIKGTQVKHFRHQAANVYPWEDPMPGRSPPDPNILITVN